MNIQSFEDLKQKLSRLENFSFKGKWTTGMVLLYIMIGIIAPIVLLFIIQYFSILIFFVVLIIFYIWGHETLSITPKYIEVKGGFTPFKVNFADIHSIEYYIVNNFSPYAKLILKRGGNKKTYIHCWKNYSSVKVEDFIKQILGFYFALNQGSPGGLL